eukprot:s2584_g9.t1
MSPVIFLDLDGVLHSVDAVEHEFFRESCVFALRRLVDSCNAQVVLSSTWRLSPELRQDAYLQLAERAVQVVGDTPRGCSRAAEILAWVEGNCSAQPWLAIDDLPLELPADHVVRTDPFAGLTEADVDEALEKINKMAVSCAALDRTDDCQTW